MTDRIRFRPRRARKSALDEKSSAIFWRSSAIAPEHGIIPAMIATPQDERWRLARERARSAYRDDRYEERACDHCAKLYRGPAVYCSLECALADA
jgi:hypothetical protein